ncbi:hypothetical protein C7999DRAFT_32734 [Corynascus novoguineensis]|uniref:DUF7707 domain-containing protein n=1 Tax=Corynascus novoguineensis TaxID=1126955 RepID=A0AAN7CRU5_9PEZI|nr:hypothetical protein C7999DRAFT_32734 [Corynascus novoguineensis]
MRQNVVLVALSALTIATAQNQDQGRNFTINPNLVKPSLKADWCGAEYNSCRVLCDNAPTANDCNVDTLEYTCTCSNGSAPGLEYYIQTIPTFICEQAYSDCIAANTASSRAQDECKTNIKDQCGTLDPYKAQVDDDSDDDTSSSATQSPTSTSNSAAETSTSTGGAAAPTNHAGYIGNGVAMIAAGVFAALL